MIFKTNWLNHLAAYIVALTICAALASFKGKTYTDSSLMTQLKITNQWAYYQAKVIKSYIYQVQYDRILMALDTLADKEPTKRREIYLAKATEYEKNIKRYELEKTYIRRETSRLEAKRDEELKRSHPFNIAVIFFQVAIICSVVAGLFNRRVLWYMSLPVGLVGFLCFANGFILFY